MSQKVIIAALKARSPQGVQELANSTGIPEPTVRSILIRAMKNNCVARLERGLYAWAADENPNPRTAGPKSTDVPLNESLRAHLERSPLPQRKLAAAIGIYPGALRRAIKGGKINPHTTDLIRLYITRGHDVSSGLEAQGEGKAVRGPRPEVRDVGQDARKAPARRSGGSTARVAQADGGPGGADPGRVKAKAPRKAPCNRGAWDPGKKQIDDIIGVLEKAEGPLTLTEVAMILGRPGKSEASLRRAATYLHGQGRIEKSDKSIPARWVISKDKVSDGVSVEVCGIPVAVTVEPKPELGATERKVTLRGEGLPGWSKLVGKSTVEEVVKLGVERLTLWKKGGGLWPRKASATSVTSNSSAPWGSSSRGIA